MQPFLSITFGAAKYIISLQLGCEESLPVGRMSTQYGIFFGVPYLLGPGVRGCSMVSPVRLIFQCEGFVESMSIASAPVY